MHPILTQALAAERVRDQQHERQSGPIQVLQERVAQAMQGPGDDDRVDLPPARSAKLRDSTEVGKIQRIGESLRGDSAAVVVEEGDKSGEVSSSRFSLDLVHLHPVVKNSHPQGNVPLRKSEDVPPLLARRVT